MHKEEAMHRFFTTDISGSTARLTGEDVHHFKRVLRLGKGDVVSLCDGRGTDYLATATFVSEQEVVFDLSEGTPSPYEPGLRATLYQGLPKGAKLDLVVQKAVEIGAAKIVPLITRRCVSEPVRDFEKKRLRFQRIADEAAKQSRRGILPAVESPLPIAQVEPKDFDLTLIAYEGERARTLKQALRGKEINTAAILIGPEGGFEEREVLALEEKGAIPVSLGKSILRTETAGLTALSCLFYEVEQ